MKVEEKGDGVIAFVCNDKEEFEVLSDNYQVLQDEFNRLVNEAANK